MSITISATTILIAVIKTVTVGAALAKATSNNIDEMNESRVEANLKQLEFINEFHNNNNHEEVSKLVCKKYDTVYADTDLLAKTLEEHGASKIVITDDTINCKIEDFNLCFSRENNEPYVLEVTCLNAEDDVEDTVSDLESEYAQNAQECTYLKIKERLSKHNLQINSEEILEDDSIMLTINLD